MLVQEVVLRYCCFDFAHRFRLRNEIVDWVYYVIPLEMDLLGAWGSFGGPFGVVVVVAVGTCGLRSWCHKRMGRSDIGNRCSYCCNSVDSNAGDTFVAVAAAASFAVGVDGVGNNVAGDSDLPMPIGEC